jgi:mannose-6-phosphate isomerase class I
LLEGDRAAIERVARRLLKPRNDNLVERPWGGRKLREWKNAAPAAGDARRYGESFEIAADDSDAEARQYPSVIDLADGSHVSLPELLAAHADEILGAEFAARHGRRFPLLPKLLDVVELLSVQAHPPGNTEVYVIVDAEPGATLRVGFNRDIDAAKLAARLTAGRAAQQTLLDLCGAAVPADELHALLQRWFAKRDAEPAELEAELAARVDWAAVAPLAAQLHALYWEVLDTLNEIPVAPGDVVYNANPPSVAAATGRPRSAEVHALGNPERREILALEIRHPGTTFRAWDNVRFPLRPIDVDAALAALNLRCTAVEDFVVRPWAVAGRPGVRRSVESEYFRLEHLDPTALVSIDVAARGPHSLHVLAGRVSVYATDGERVGRLARGDSALVPVGVGAYRVVADGDAASLVKVDLPPYVD